MLHELGVAKVAKSFSLNAILVPSGEKIGFDSMPSSMVSRLGFDPSLFAIHKSSAYIKAI